MAKRPRIPRTNQMISVFKRQLYKSDFKITNVLRIDQNRWKVTVKDPITGKIRTAIVDKSDMRSLRRFKSVVRHQI